MYNYNTVSVERILGRSMLMFGYSGYYDIGGRILSEPGARFLNHVTDTIRN